MNLHLTYKLGINVEPNISKYSTRKEKKVHEEVKIPRSKMKLMKPFNPALKFLKFQPYPHFSTKILASLLVYKKK